MVDSHQTETSSLARRRQAAQAKDRDRYSAKRNMILEAAGPVLLREGLAATTMGTIAKEAGVDRATVYYYFVDKFDIFRTAIHDGVSSFIIDIDKVRKSDAPPDERLRESIRTLMRAYSDHYPHLFIYFNEGEGSEVIDRAISAEMLDSRHHFGDTLMELIEDGIAAGEFHDIIPPKLAVHFIVGMLTWTHRWFRPDGLMNADTVASLMTDLVLRGLTTCPQDAPSRAAPRRRTPRA